MAEKPRVFMAGTKVEVCPFRRGFSHHYLGHMDGQEGVVKKAKGTGHETKLVVELDGTGGGEIEIPLAALRPCEPKAEPKDLR